MAIIFEAIWARRSRIVVAFSVAVLGASAVGLISAVKAARNAAQASQMV